MVGMDLLQLEEHCKEYFKLKSQIKSLEEKFKEIRINIIGYMVDNNKRILKVQSYSLELKPRVSKKIDRKAIYSLIEQGKLPNSIITGEQKTMQLFIQEGTKLKLSGNKFVSDDD